LRLNIESLNRVTAISSLYDIFITGLTVRAYVRDNAAMLGLSTSLGTILIKVKVRMTTKMQRTSNRTAVHLMVMSNRKRAMLLWSDSLLNLQADWLVTKLSNCKHFELWYNEGNRY